MRRFFSQCSSLKHIPDVAKGLKDTREFKRLPKKLSKINNSLAHVRQTREKTKKAVNRSSKVCLTQIHSIREQFNVIFDQLERDTLSKIDARKKSLASRVQSDIDIIDEVMTNLQKLIASIKDLSETNEAMLYIWFTKCNPLVSQALEVMQNVEKKGIVKLAFEPNKEIA